MRAFQFAIIGGVLIVLGTPSCADPIVHYDPPAPGIHYAPTENLEVIDVGLIDRAEYEIDLAAYWLTDRPVIQALIRAADRGVNVRIYLDAGQTEARTPPIRSKDLAITPTVTIRAKFPGEHLMHLIEVLPN